MAELVEAGGRVSVIGQTYAEDGGPSDVLSVHVGQRRNWSARVFSTDQSSPANVASDAGRRTFVCKGRRHTLRRVVSEDAYTAGYHKARQAGRPRISVTELR